MLVICNGMMRSGSTLQYNISATLLETHFGVTRMGFLGKKDAPEVRDRLLRTARKDAWAIVKMHEFIALPEEHAGHVMMLFTFRDLRDIAASVRKKWDYPFEQIIDILDAMVLLEGKTRRWPNSLIQKYEHMYRDLRGSVAEIAAMLGIEPSPATCEVLAERFSIEQVSQRLNSNWRYRIGSTMRRVLARKPFDPATLLHQGHISASQGRPGAWEDVMSPAEIKTLDARYGDWLVAHGYRVA